MRSLIAAAVAGALLAGSAQEWRHDARYAELRLSYEQAAKEELERHRKREHELQERIAIIDQEAQDEIKELNRVIDAANSESGGLRGQLSDLARKHREAAAAAGECASQSAAIGVLSDMLGSLSESAKVYAADSDRNRIAVQSCSASYEAAMRLCSGE